MIRLFLYSVFYWFVSIYLAVRASMLAPVSRKIRGGDVYVALVEVRDARGLFSSEMSLTVVHRQRGMSELWIYPSIQ